jgi:hypothetical protein
VGVPESSASNGRNNDAGSAELIGTNEEASIVEEILLDLIESSTGVVVSNGTKTPKEDDVEIVGVKETILQTLDDINTQEGLKEHQERHGLVRCFTFHKGWFYEEKISNINMQFTHTCILSF